MRLVTVLLLGLLFTVPALAAPPPPGAEPTRGTAGEHAAWLGEASSVSNQTALPGEKLTAWFAVRALNATNTTRWAIVNVSTWEGASSLNLSLNGSEWAVGNVTAVVPRDPVGNLTVYYEGSLFESTPNGTVEIDRFGGALSAVASIVVPAPLVPTSWLIGGGIVLLLAVAVGAYSARQRSVQRRMRGRARSQALREQELEQQVVKRPQEVQRVKEEIQQQEQVRVQRRESQILEAKKADVLKNMELLKKRHEMGGLTKLQYETMLAKRQADLQRIEAEIAEFERSDN